MGLGQMQQQVLRKVENLDGERPVMNLHEPLNDDLFSY